MDVACGIMGRQERRRRHVERLRFLLRLAFERTVGFELRNMLILSTDDRIS